MGRMRQPEEIEEDLRKMRGGGTTAAQHLRYERVCSEALKTANDMYDLVQELIAAEQKVKELEAKGTLTVSQCLTALRKYNGQCRQSGGGYNPLDEEMQRIGVRILGSLGLLRESKVIDPPAPPAPKTFEEWCKQHDIIHTEEFTDNYRNCWTAAQQAKQEDTIKEFKDDPR